MPSQRPPTSLVGGLWHIKNICHLCIGLAEPLANRTFGGVILLFPCLLHARKIFRAFGFRFLFYSNDRLPIHVHVRNSDGEARFSINPVQLLDNRGMKSKDLKFAEGLIEENEDIIEQRWKEFSQQ